MDLLCQIRDLNRSIAEFESAFERRYELSMNEGMLLCTLSKMYSCSSGEIAEKLSLTPSNASKVICSVERKGLIERVMGNSDKRQMYFSLTAKGEQKLSNIKCAEIEIPDYLQRCLTSTR